MELDHIYTVFNEEDRLNSKATQVEFLTTVHYMDKYLKPGMKILDIGAGTGAYSIYYAKKGYDVCAVEPVSKHIEIIKSKVTPEMNIDVILGNALDLSQFEEESFDLILCLGPMYHLEYEESRMKCIEEVKRVCKRDGLMFFGYISNDMVFITEFALYNPKLLRSSAYDAHTFHLNGDFFHFQTVKEMDELMKKNKLTMLHHVRADGLSELLADKINSLSDEDYVEWIKYHLYTCEKPELLGYSNHIIYIGKK